MSRRTAEKEQLDYVSTWEDASEISIKTYTYYVRWFLEQYGEISIDTLKKELLAIPMEHFAKRLKLYHALTSLAKVLVEEGALSKAFLVESKRFRLKRRLPEKKLSVDLKSLETLVDACESPLERLIVILLSQTGLRVSEAANLKLDNVSFGAKILNVRLAKWGKTRRVGLQNKVVETIQDYLEAHNETEEEWLFINRNGNRMDRFGLRNRLNRIGIRADVKVTPHALRRAFVTLNANKGRPLVMLQIACGHNDIATTRSYCMTTEDETIEAMQGWE